MARMFPAVYAPTDGDANVAGRRLFGRLQRELDSNWQAIHDAALGFVLLHRDLGIALIVPPGRTEPSRAVADFRARLDEIGFTRNFRSGIAVIVEAIDPQDRRDVFAVLAAGFAAVAPATPADPTWPDWLVQRLVPLPLAAQPRGGVGLAALRAPTLEDSWRSAATPVVDRGAAVRVIPERRLHAEDLDTRSPLWTGMALAIFVVALVLTAMALLSHGNGASSERSPPAAAAAPR